MESPCPTGKSRFHTYGQAEHRAGAMNRYRDHDGEFFAVYRCRDCGGYHIAGKDAKQARMQRRRPLHGRKRR